MSGLKQEAGTATQDKGNDNDEDWETESSSDEKRKKKVPNSSAIGPGGRPVQRRDLKELLELAEETNAFLLSLMCDPKLDRNNPLASPKPLFNACDFARRTYLEYIVPLFPKEAPHKVLEMANPFVFDYPNRGAGTVFDRQGGFKTDMAWLENEANWPEWNADLEEKFSDAVGRNTVIALIVLQRDEKGPMMMQGKYDFQPATMELAKGLKREEVVEWKERMQDARKAVGLAGRGWAQQSQPVSTWEFKKSSRASVLC